MTPFALLLLVRGEGGGYGAAGLVVAVYTIALGIGAPVRGRRVDRLGPTPVLRVGAVAYAGFLAAVVALALVDAATAVLATTAALAGFIHPPIGSTVRIVWPRIAPGDLRSTAYAFEAAMQEAFFVVGPLLAAALAAVEPALAVAAAGLASLLGTIALSRLPPVREMPPSRSEGAGLLGALGSPGVRTVVLYAAVVGIAFGSVELAMPAFAEQEGSRELGGIALACFAAGSLVGGLLAGMRPPRDDVRRFVGGALALGVALLGLQLAVSLPTLAVLAFVAGLPIAPDRGGALLLDRPHGTHGNRGRGVCVVRHCGLDRVRCGRGSGGRSRRGARRALGVRLRGGRRPRRRAPRLAAPQHAPRRATVYAHGERP